LNNVNALTLEQKLNQNIFLLSTDMINQWFKTQIAPKTKWGLQSNPRQNRRQKVFDKGALRLCRGVRTQNSTYLWCFIFQFGGIEALFVGA